MNLSVLLEAAGLLIYAASTFLLGRSYIRIGNRELQEIGAGAVLTDLYVIFGFRKKVIQSVCRQRADALLGICILAIGMILQFVGLMLRQLSCQLHLNLFWGLFIVIAFLVCVFIVASTLSRLVTVKFLQSKIREAVLGSPPWRWQGEIQFSKGQERLRQEVNKLLANLASKKQINSFINKLEEQIRNPYYPPNE